MSFLLVRSIPLGRSTMSAWRSVGGVFAERDWHRQPWMYLDDMALGHEFVLNLGNRNLSSLESRKVMNQYPDIHRLTTPGGTRRLMPDLLPRQTPGQVWVKAPGRAGEGKFLVETDEPLVLPQDWDWQEHIVGQEYRIITVGHRIVQDSLRYGENGHREYVWTPMGRVPTEVKEVARTAARTVRGSNVIAWDVIAPAAGGGAYILEGNTSPGMSEPTARRIVDEIRGRLL